MDKDRFKLTIDQVRKISPKRKFSQSVDLIINLKGLDLKKPDNHVDFFVALPHPKGKKSKVCALVGPEMGDQAKKICDTTILAREFDKIGADKKALRKLANTHDYFIAQANIMPQVAKAFGRVFGPKGKMPNPKAGCVVPPSANLQPLYDKLQKTVRVLAKVQLCVQCLVGNESMKDEDIIDNIMTVYNQLVHHLPNEQNNIKTIFMKLTMGKSVKVGVDYSKVAEEKKEEPKEKKPKKKKKGSKEDKPKKKKKTKEKTETPKEEKEAEEKTDAPKEESKPEEEEMSETEVSEHNQKAKLSDKVEG